MRRGLELQNAAGFTLIETLIYVTFLSLMMGTLLAITFSTIDSTSQINKKIVIQQEANFLIRKIAWALTGASTAVVNLQGTTLTITNSSNSYVFNASNPYLDLNNVPLNSQNALISNFAVTTTGTPEQISVGFTVSYLNDKTNSNSQNFQFTSYLRQ